MTWDDLTWEQKRGAVLAQALFVCEMCETAEATEVDHIWPRRFGGSDQRDNLRATCRTCNAEKGSQIVYDDIDVNPALVLEGAVFHRREALSALVAAAHWSAFEKLMRVSKMSAVAAHDALLRTAAPTDAADVIWDAVDRLARERWIAAGTKTAVSAEVDA